MLSSDKSFKAPSSASSAASTAAASVWSAALSFWAIDKSSLAIKIPGYGIYFVQLSDSQKTITKKVVLN